MIKLLKDKAFDAWGIIYIFKHNRSESQNQPKKNQEPQLIPLYFNNMKTQKKFRECIAIG